MNFFMRMGRGVWPPAAVGLLLLVFCGTALSWSSPGTPERAAEDVAVQKMAQNYPAYAVYACQMRSNGLSVAIAARNRIGSQVNFRCLTRKVTRRDGTVYYEVAAPEIVQ